MFLTLVSSKEHDKAKNILNYSSYLLFIISNGLEWLLSWSIGKLAKSLRFKTLAPILWTLTIWSQAATIDLNFWTKLFFFISKKNK